MFVTLVHKHENEVVAEAVLVFRLQGQAGMAAAFVLFTGVTD